MKWITREQPKIDRIACPWLIQRFIDAEAEFLYVPADRVAGVAAASGAAPTPHGSIWRRSARDCTRSPSGSPLPSPSTWKCCGTGSCVTTRSMPGARTVRTRPAAGPRPTPGRAS